MKSIADRAGVTQATVSMALSNNPRISPATRERIQGIAQDMGYRPNPYISTLMRIRRQGRPLKDKPVLALVCGLDTADGWRNHASVTIRQMRVGAIERATLRGYRAQEFWLHRDGMSSKRFSEILHARGIQGVLLSPLADTGVAPVLKWEYFAAVSLTVPHPELTVTTVCHDHYFSMLRIMRECYRRGYRRPGLVLLRSHHLRFQGRWQAGYFVAPEIMPEMKVGRPLYVEGWHEQALIVRWLEREKPDVVISPGEDGLMETFTEAGWKIPRDLGLVWLSSNRPDHPCSSIYQNGELIGATAMDALVAKIERHDIGLPQQATTTMVEGIWNPGTTLREI